VGLYDCGIRRNIATSVALASLAAASSVCAVGSLIGNPQLVEIADYLFLGSAVFAWYAASALMLRRLSGREVWSNRRKRICV